MSDVGRIGPSSPEEKKLYEQDYKQGAELFQQALDAHAKANSPYKKEEFRQVMEQAMRAMNESVRGLKQEDERKAKFLEKQNKQIEKDFTSYQNGGKPDPLKTDLEQAKRSV